MRLRLNDRTDGGRNAVASQRFDDELGDLFGAQNAAPSDVGRVMATSRRERFWGTTRAGA